MSAQVIDGAFQARLLKKSLEGRVLALKSEGITPGLAAILVGDDPSSHVYVRSKCAQCEEVGIASYPHFLQKNTSAQELLSLIHALNKDPKIHGILLQLPLPAPLNARDFIEEIAPYKDVDGLSLVNAGRLVAGLPGIVACTPKGCLKLLKSVYPDLTGKHAVVIGRSALVGAPMAQLLLQANCSVSIVHSKTRNPEIVTRLGDILVVAAGRAHLAGASWVKPGACVIDVGMHASIDSHGVRRLRGDVDFDTVKEVAGYITPVPGGVGPMTVACLLENTVEIAERVHASGLLSS